MRHEYTRIVAVLAALCPAVPRAAPPAAPDLAELSLEQLGNIVVTSVSRREELLVDAPASVFVITAEDIRRSGATSLPEALRLAPNLDVARADANQYAVSARGFNNLLANKLLVLIDGRTIYTPLFSGVFWDAQDVMLEDVDRIEVISGPGATLWGANAVNGVINVITRPASDTQGPLAAVGAGNRESGAVARYGGPFGADGHYRVYAKAFHRNHTRMADGASVRDASDRVQTGFRADWGDALQSFTLQGDAYEGNIDQLPSARSISGANLLGRWSGRRADGSSLRLQVYVDHTQRDHPQVFAERLDTLDVEFQHILAPVGRHSLLWGAGYRRGADRVRNSAMLAFYPADKNLAWTHLFAEDRIALTPSFDVSVGAKVETNAYTGAEFLPSLRLAWRAAPNRLVWGALSRAVRAPSRIDREFFVPAAAPFVIAGGPDFVSEVSDTLEIGYRAQSGALSYSATVFRHRHRRLRSLDATPAGAMIGNDFSGTTTGIEAWGTYRVSPAWRLGGGVVAMRQRLQLAPGSTDIGGTATLGNDPAHWWSLRSSLDVAPNVAFDLALRRVGARPDPSVPAHTAVDARLGWRLRRDLEVALNVQNALDAGHPEWGAAGSRPEFERGVFLQLLWRP